MGFRGPLRGSPIMARRSAPDPLDDMAERFATHGSASLGSGAGSRLLIPTIVLLLLVNAVLYSVAAADRYWLALFVGYVGGPAVNGLLFLVGSAAILLRTRGWSRRSRVQSVLILFVAAVVSAGLLAAGVAAMRINGC